jgi:hypothetical protein
MYHQNTLKIFSPQYDDMFAVIGWDLLGSGKICIHCGHWPIYSVNKL